MSSIPVRLRLKFGAEYVPIKQEPWELGFARIEHLIDLLESSDVPEDRKLSISDAFINMPVTEKLFDNDLELYERLRNYKGGPNTQPTIDSKYLAYMVMCKMYDVFISNKDYELKGKTRTEIMTCPKRKHAYTKISTLFDSGLINVDNRGAERTQVVLDSYKSAYEMITVDNSDLDQVKSVKIKDKSSIDEQLAPFNLLRYQLTLENMTASRVIPIKPDYDELVGMFSKWDNFNLSQRSYITANFISHLTSIYPDYNPLDILRQYSGSSTTLIPFLDALQPLLDMSVDLRKPDTIHNVFIEYAPAIDCPDFEL